MKNGQKNLDVKVGLETKAILDKCNALSSSNL